MSIWFLLSVIVVVVVVLAAIKKAQGTTDADNLPWPFYAKKPLTTPEQVLYFRLCAALPEHIVLAQVGLSRILGVKKGQNFREWNNRINRMSADFVVCAKDASVVAVIELDDSSHDRADRQIADAKKNKALAAAGIRIVRWQPNALPDATAIQAMVVQSKQSSPPEKHAITER